MVSTFQILLKKTKRDWKHHLFLYLMIISIAGLAVCLLIGFLANHLDFEKRGQIINDNGAMSDLWIDTNKDSSQINLKDNVDNIQETDTRFKLITLAYNLPVNLIGTLDTPILNIPYDQTGTNDFIVDYYYAELNHLRINDNITLKMFCPSSMSPLFPVFQSLLKDGQTDTISNDGSINLTFKISGLMKHPECLDYGNSNPTFLYTSIDNILQQIMLSLENTYNILPIKSELISLISNELKPNQLLVKLIDKSHLTNTISNIQEYLKTIDITSKIADRTEVQSNQALMSDIKQAQYLTYVFPIVFFLVGFLVVITTLTQLVFKERTQIGLMKSIGLTNGQVYSHYLFLSFVLITIGFIVGGTVGIFLIPTVMTQKYDLLFHLPKLTYLIPIVELLVSYLSILSAVLLITYLICRSEVNQLPWDSLTKKNAGKQYPLMVNQKKFHFYFITSIRNLIINWKKSLMVIVGIMGCTALLICGFGIENTIQYGLDTDFEKLYKYDIELTYNGNDNKSIILSDSSVDHLESFSSQSVNLLDYSKTTTLRIIEKDSKIVNQKIKEDTVGVSTKLVREYNLKVGDYISFQVDGVDYNKEISFLYSAFFYHGILTTFDTMSTTIRPTGGWILTKENTDSKELSKNLVETSLVAQAIEKDNFLQRINKSLSGIKLMTLTLKIFAIGLAVVVLVNIALLNYQERARDIATLKVIGLRNSEICFSLLIEILVLTFLGVLVGSFGGYPMTWLVLKINETPLISFLYHIDPISYLIAIIITGITASVVNLGLMSFSDSISMSEALKSYE